MSDNKLVNTSLNFHKSTDVPAGAPRMPDQAADNQNKGFSFRTRKNGDVEILHQGRLASTLRSRAALDFLAEMDAGDQANADQVMARITGNYKRRNERLAGQHPRNRC